MRSLRIVTLVGLLLVFGHAALVAHDTAPGPVVDILFRSDGERLAITARLPISAVSDANLPRDRDGRLVVEELAQPLQLVARQIASSLEVEESESLLAMPAVEAALAEDQASIQVRLVYRTRGAGSLSARLHPFWTGFTTIPTVARFEDSRGAARTFEISGLPERVIFNPGVLQAASYFARTGSRVLLGSWDIVLFGIAIALARDRRARRISAIALFACEIVAAAAAAWLSWPPALLPAMMTLAASTIVVAALHAVFGGASRWLAPLAVAFGLASGFSVGHAFREALAYAGSHQVPSFGVLLIAVLLGHLWILTLLSSAVDALDRYGVPTRATAIAASIYMGHAALHRLGSTATLVAEATTVAPERIVLGLTLVWLVIVLAVNLLPVVRGGAPATSDLAGLGVRR